MPYSWHTYACIHTVPNILDVWESDNCLTSVFASPTLKDLTAQRQSLSLFPFPVSWQRQNCDSAGEADDSRVAVEKDFFMKELWYQKPLQKSKIEALSYTWHTDPAESPAVSMYNGVSPQGLIIDTASLTS